MTRLVPALILLLITSCNRDKDLDKISGFEPVSEGWVFEDLSLPEVYDYMELRLSFDYEGEHSSVLDSSGVKCPGTISGCPDRFDTLKAYKPGFHAGCLPDHCSRYIVTRKGSAIETWVSTDELKTWLGAIDNTGDALLWVYAHGYNFEYDNSEVSGIKQENGRFYVVALKLVSACLPVQSDRFLLVVNSSGNISILDQELHHQSGGCI